MRVKIKLTQFPRLILWTGFAALVCVGFPLRGGAEVFNYEKLHQRALSDGEFKQADEELNEAYVRTMRKLSKEERAKLRQEERAWIQENARAVQQTPGREVEVLRERTRKRLEELRLRGDGGIDSKAGNAPRLTLDSPSGLQLGKVPAADDAAGKSAASGKSHSNILPEKETAPQPVAKEAEARRDVAKPAEQSGENSGEEASWTPKLAANLERVYQKSLKNAEFEAADSELRSFYRQAMQVLSPADREKLRVAEKAWVRQNGMLLRNAGEREAAVLKERTAQRRMELEQMVKERRFQEGAPVVEKTAAPAPGPVKAPAVLELPVEPLPVKAPEPAPAPATPQAPTEAKSPGDSDEAAEPGHLTEKGFWMFLASWIFGLTALHYGAFRSVQKNPSRELTRELSPVRLYILSAACAGTSLSMLASGGGVVWMAASVSLTVLGLLVVWYAALAVAVLSRDSADMVAASGPQGASVDDSVR